HLWVAREKIATAIGLIMCVGGAGALLASTPTQLMIDAIGWRHMFLILAGLTAVFALAVFSIRGHVRPAAQQQSVGELWRGVVTVFSNGPFWLVCTPMMLTLGSMLAFQSLWA